MHKIKLPLQIQNQAAPSLKEDSKVGMMSTKNSIMKKSTIIEDPSASVLAGDHKKTTKNAESAGPKTPFVGNMRRSQEQ
jgi:hypothetical protein